ncbi:apoptosis-inducing factor 2 [Echria macrotheca]|uniref:Apoptosis-inducing factor 2 n=1 Tax=Echria macrotheca TaxID=438768 RepID=A0AAJ0F1U2_9PEZI|nr:apoptosis-inducing factor 2 [Echria macrotheca]
MAVTQRLQKSWLFTRLVCYGCRIYFSTFRRNLSAKIAGLAAKPPKEPVDPSEVKTIVIVGAAFAGYYAAQTLASSLPRNGKYRVIVIEPHSHFNFTWVLPRFCVVEGHEHKAFIPYTPDFFANSPEGIVNWVRDRVVSVERHSVRLAGGDEIAYDFLIVATGSYVSDGLPSRVGADDKESGVELLRGMQARVKTANHIVVAGGGAAGVELATDAASQYPDKSITLVHSRSAVMHRFGLELQTAALDALRELGVTVILEDKVVPGSADGKCITLTSGKTIECDCFINCTGQKPASDIITGLAPKAISPSGHIKVKPTLQIADDTLPNVYVCGDVAETHESNPNSRIASRQAQVAADNVVLAVRGKTPKHTYTPKFGDGVIKLTLGLDRSITHFWDGKSELSFPGKETDLALMCDGAWSAVATTPFEDTGVYKGETVTPASLKLSKAIEEV